MHLVINVHDTGDHPDCPLQKLFQVVGREASRHNDRLANQLDGEQRGPTSEMGMLLQSVSDQQYQPRARQIRAVLLFCCHEPG